MFGVALLGLTAIGALFLLSDAPRECLWDAKAVGEWLDKWQALPTMVLEEGVQSYGAGLDISLPPGYKYAILLRTNGDWLFFVDGYGWQDGQGYKADFCNGDPPGAHLAPPELEWTL